MRHPVVIIGGPAGLTAAHELATRGIQPLVLERDRIVGGLARTEAYKGFHFDVVGHRFYTKVDEIRRLWTEMLGDDFLSVRRLSRIIYRERIRRFLATIENLHTIGRNGMHRYNNQDHSMLTGLFAVRNLFGESHDLWEVNTERSYAEEFVVADGTAAGRPAAP